MVYRLALALRSLAALALIVPALSAQNERQTPSTSFGTISIADAAVKLRSLIDQPVPAGLSTAELKSYQGQTDWLKTVVLRLDQAVAMGREHATGQASGKVVAPRDVATGQASGKRQPEPVKTVLSPDVDLFKRAIQEESRKFTMLSNILKTRHDAAMNAIRNMKG